MAMKRMRQLCNRECVLSMDSECASSMDSNCHRYEGNASFLWQRMCPFYGQWISPSMDSEFHNYEENAPSLWILNMSSIWLGIRPLHRRECKVNALSLWTVNVSLPWQGKRHNYGQKVRQLYRQEIHHLCTEKYPISFMEVTRLANKYLLLLLFGDNILWLIMKMYKVFFHIYTCMQLWQGDVVGNIIFPLSHPILCIILP